MRTGSQRGRLGTPRITGKRYLRSGEGHREEDMKISVVKGCEISNGRLKVTEMWTVYRETAWLRGKTVGKSRLAVLIAGWLVLAG
jgi:hypothetical protein